MTTVFVGWLFHSLAALAAVPPVWAQASSSDAATPSPTVDVVGACPAKGTVMDALLPVLAKDALRAAREPTRVIDLGDRYEVSAAGQTAQYADAARDCGERARVAAVFIALGLNPPAIPAIEPPRVVPPPPAPEPPASERKSEPGPPLWKWLAIGARVDAALESAGAPSTSSAGVEVRGALGQGAFGVVAGAAALLPSTVPLNGISVRQERFPFSLALVLRGRVASWFELGGQVGAALVIMTLRAEGIEGAGQVYRLDAGARLAVEGRGPALGGLVVPFLALHAEIFPRTYVLDIDPVGKVGTTNRFWLGASAGLAFESP